jgi:hypothetical protein
LQNEREYYVVNLSGLILQMLWLCDKVEGLFYQSRAHSVLSVMSELANDGSMAENKGQLSSNKNYSNKEVMLRELQKSIHFVKTLTPSNISGSCLLVRLFRFIWRVVFHLYTRLTDY